MTRLAWDLLEEREIRYGVDRGVIYPREETPVVWNGLVSVVENPTDADHEVSYYDGIPYTQRKSPEGFAASIEAFTYPEVLDRVTEFDFSYRGLSNKNPVVHLVYNARLSSSDIDYETLNAEVDSSTFSWSLTTIPEQNPGLRPTAHVIIDGTDAYSDVMQILEDLLYGTDEAPPRIPHLPELIEIFDDHPVLLIVDHGDGTWSAIGPEDMIEMTSSTSFQIKSPSAFYIDSETYTISNW